MRADILWFVLSAIFFTIGIVTALGEWVFHWWQDPWHWASPASLLLGLLTFAWGASARNVQEFREEMRKGHQAMLRGQEAMHRGQEEVRRGQDDLRGGQERLLAGQAEQTALLREATAILREHTTLLREVEASFRRT